jgi:hypothetical protein
MNNGISIPNFDEIYILRGGHAQRQPYSFTNDHYFKVDVFRATIDTQLTELNMKFNEKVMDLLSISVTLIQKMDLLLFDLVMYATWWRSTTMQILTNKRGLD